MWRGNLKLTMTSHHEGASPGLVGHDAVRDSVRSHKTGIVRSLLKLETGRGGAPYLPRRHGVATNDESVGWRSDIEEVVSMRRIRITAGNVVAFAALNDTQTANAVWNALPIRGKVNLWGDEIYFSIPVEIGSENGRAVVDAGDLGYWPPGKAFCIFWGPTPASVGDEIRPASPVNVFGRLEEDARAFDGVLDGAPIVVERVEG